MLSVRGLSASGVKDVSFDLRAGEILGLAGLVGAGRTELARALYRAHRVTAGTISMAEAGPPDTRRRSRGPRAALRAGLAMIPESRKEDGLMPRRSVRENVSLASLDRLNRGGIVRSRPERRTVQQVLRELDVRARSQAVPADTLSGGNQQKLLFARVLLCKPRVLIADEPTRGVDVGAKRAIYELLTSLTSDGLGVLLISSEVEEILGLAHRVLVMRAGQIAAELTGEQITEAAILTAAFGATERGAS